MTLRGVNAEFHCEDSLAWLKKTDRAFDLVVSDTPFDGPFYDDDDLPVFLDDLLRVAAPGGVVLFNIHGRHLTAYQKTIDLVAARAGTRPIRDLFIVVRNTAVAYLVVAFGA
jgi:23S rRNA G2069 N7-methylase RlmK/C1962 C5-methylase RlmI